MDNRQRRLTRNCPTLAQALDRYLAEVSVKKKSGYQERSIVKVWKATIIAARNLARITIYDLKNLRDQWLNDRKPATVIRRLALISHLYTIARKEWGFHCLANPVQLVTRPVADDARDRRLFNRIRLNGVSAEECPRSEFEWISRATKSKALPTIMLLARETAMRRSEIVMLKREQIDMHYGVVTLTETKNGDTRYVPLSPFAKDALRKWLVGLPMRGRIFDITPGAVTRAFSRARIRARKLYDALCAKHGRKPVPAYFQDLRFHDLRHEATSILAEVYPSQHLRKVTGHHCEKSMDRYFHPRGRDLVIMFLRSKLGRWQLEQLKLAA